MTTELTFEAEGRAHRIAVSQLIVAGWTGRDMKAVQHHIDELAALGVPAPSTVPLHYRVAAGLLSTTDRLQVLENETSGEAEPLLIHDGQTLWLGLGSDHTDRGLETVSVAHAKQACGKPVATGLWRFDALADRLDTLELASFVREDADADWIPYQRGTLAEIRPLADLMAALPDGGLRPGMAMLCGTLAAIGGVRPARHFRMELTDPETGRHLSHSYAVEALPVVA
ncbi:DUF2848 domain-containing protein [Pararhodobacter sp. SW119]|uniref:DUF2848 domain-containing protein n=1 Tax=Pararhodobacter sp. SW119 TaxID=2780075 RepID=UPI001FD787BD|nr:DUF2848 domain-containing protein [Pararhodobacter sp. SW119]